MSRSFESVKLIFLVLCCFFFLQWAIRQLVVLFLVEESYRINLFIWNTFIYNKQLESFSLRYVKSNTGCCKKNKSYIQNLTSQILTKLSWFKNHHYIYLSFHYHLLNFLIKMVESAREVAFQKDFVKILLDSWTSRILYFALPDR